MDKPWLNSFLSSTGLQGSQEAYDAPVNAVRQQEARGFQGVYDQASTNPMPSALGAPGTVTSAAPFIPGTMPRGESLQHTPFRSQYENTDLMNHTDGLIPARPTEQKNWVTPGIWRNSNPVLEREPASGPIPGSAYSGGYQERMGGEDSTKYLRIASAVMAGIGVLSGGAYAMNRETRYEKQYLGVSVVSVLIAVALFIVSSAGNKENQRAYGDRRVLMDTNFAPPVYPVQADQPLAQPYPAFRDPADTIESRFQMQGTDTNTLEGPRANVGYRRAPPTPDGRQVLPSSDLMRQPGNYNMDEGTYQEYMRRLNGEAPPQVVASHPYYTFNAQFENRAQIDDSATYFGIADTPSQMLRQSPYRDPKIQQAGARRMHLKDPPPGSNPPLQKTHPWMEEDESGKTPAFYATPGDERMHGGPEIMEIVEQEEEPDVDKMKVAEMVKERFQQLPPGQPVDQDFLKPQSTASERKLRLMKGGEMPEPEGLHKGMPVQREPQQIEVPREQRKQVPLNENPADALHSTDPDGEFFEDSDDLFSSQFNSNTAPSQEVIDRALSESSAR